MSLVEVYDFECEKCKRITIAELNIKARIYTCLKCGTEFKAFRS